MNSMQTLRAHAIWNCRLAKLYFNWSLVRIKYMVKIACCDLGILWCNVKIFWYR